MIRVKKLRRDWGCAFAQGRQLLTPKMFCAFTENDSASCGKTSTKPFGLGVEGVEEGNWDIMMSTIFGQVKEHANSVCMQTTLHRRGFGENFQSEAARAKFLQKLKRLSLCFAFRCPSPNESRSISFLDLFCCAVWNSDAQKKYSDIVSRARVSQA